MANKFYGYAGTEREIIPYHIWSYFPNSTILKYIHKLHPKDTPLEIDCTSEPELDYTPFYSDENVIMKTRDWSNTQVDIIYPTILSEEDIHYYENLSPDVYLKPTRHSFALFFLYHTFISLEHNIYPTPYFNYYDFEFNVKNIECYFSCFNLHMRENKAVLLQSLHDLGLLENNIYSQVFPFDIKGALANIKKHNDTRYKLFNFLEYNVELKILDNPDEFSNQKSYFRLNPHYLKSAFQIVSETHDFLCAYTEKTFWPLLSGKPFIISGAPKVNYHLQKFGFKLYDNIFDYSFDFEPDPVIRKRKLAAEVQRIIGLYEPTKLYNLLKETAIYNRKVAHNIIFNFKFIPKKFLEWVEKYKNNEHFNSFHILWYNDVKRYVKNYKSKKWDDTLWKNKTKLPNSKTLI